MNEQILHALNIGVPVWISNFSQKVDVSIAASNIKPVKINKRDDIVLTERNCVHHSLLINNKKSVPWGVDIRSCLFLSEEQAIAHYNRCVDACITESNAYYNRRLASLEERKI